MGTIAPNAPFPPPRVAPNQPGGITSPADGTPGREHDRPGGHRLAVTGAIDARPPKTRPRTEICGHPPSWTREPRQTPQITAGSLGPHHHPTGHANQNNPTAKTHDGSARSPLEELLHPARPRVREHDEPGADTRVSAVMTSTETDSGHTIQRWGHRRWPHGDRPDPDATVTAEAIEQRPGVPSTQAPTHPNREPTPLGTTRSTSLDRPRSY